MFLVDMVFTQIEKITPELTEQHRHHLSKEYRNNTLMFGGRKEPRTGGILISKHASEVELRQVLNTDPFIKSGAVNYSITEFVPVMASDEYLTLIS